MAVVIVLVAHMPHVQRRVVAVPLCQPGVDLRHLAAVIRGGVAGVVACAIHIGLALLIHAQHRGIFFRHPRGTGTAGGCQNGLHTIAVEHVHHFIQPRKVVYTVLWLQKAPGEDAHVHLVDAGLFGFAHILLPDGVLPLDPLFRVVIRTMKKGFVCHGDSLAFAVLVMVYQFCMRCVFPCRRLHFRVDLDGKNRVVEKEKEKPWKTSVGMWKNQRVLWIVTEA